MDSSSFHYAQDKARLRFIKHEKTSSPSDPSDPSGSDDDDGDECIFVGEDVATRS